MCAHRGRDLPVNSRRNSAAVTEPGPGPLFATSAISLRMSLT